MVWGADQLESKAGTLGISDLLVGRHAPVIKGSQLGKGILRIGSRPSEFPLTPFPDADHPQPDSAVLAKQHVAQIEGTTGLQAALAQEAFALWGLHHDLVLNPNDKAVPLLFHEDFQEADPPKYTVGQETGCDLDLAQHQTDELKEIVLTDILGP